MSRPDPSPPDPSPPDPAPHPARVRRLRWVGGGFALLAIAIVAEGMVARAAERARLRELAETQAVPTVAVVVPADAGQFDAGHHGSLDLPGRLEAYIRAPIYARVPGYLKSWKHDIGSRVRAGDVLAEIDTPDLDQQLAQARAELGVAQANAKLARIGAERWQSLAGTDAVAQQDVDTRVFTLNANLAQVKSAQANVDRLAAEAGFKRLRAPFDGVVTARATDIGALINVGAAGGAELFEVSETARLRVYVNVPQADVPSVPRGTRAVIRVPEHPDKSYTGTVEASAQAVSASSGTTLMQIIVDNPAGEMMPGDYASVRLQITDANHALTVPASALIFDARGLSVATVDAANRVRLKAVSVGRDLGSTVELASGVAPDDRIIENPPDGVSDGAEVRLATATRVPPASAGTVASRARRPHDKA